MKILNSPVAWVLALVLGFGSVVGTGAVTQAIEAAKCVEKTSSQTANFDTDTDDERNKIVAISRTVKYRDCGTRIRIHSASLGLNVVGKCDEIRSYVITPTDIAGKKFFTQRLNCKSGPVRAYWVVDRAIGPKTYDKCGTFNIKFDKRRAVDSHGKGLMRYCLRT